MLTGPCLSLILLHHRVKSGYPVGVGGGGGVSLMVWIVFGYCL